MSQTKIEKLARMANQIGDYYAIQPPGEAAAGLATHIAKFWTPKMIAETLAAAAQDKIVLNETAARGFARLRQDFAGTD